MDTYEHQTTMQQMFALREEMATRVLEARRHSFLARHEPEMEKVIDSAVYVRNGRRRYCLGCLQWAERHHDDSPMHRSFLEQYHQWDQETRDEFLSRRAQRSLELMTDPPARGGMPLVLRSRSAMRTSDSPTRTRITLRSRSPSRPRINEEAKTEKMQYPPPSSRRLPEHVVLYRKHPYCLLCSKWDDSLTGIPSATSCGSTTSWPTSLSREWSWSTNGRSSYSGSVWSLKRVLMKRIGCTCTLRDWKYCLACQQWEDDIHGKTETHLKRVARFSRMTSRDQAYFLAEQREEADQALHGGMLTNEATDHEELTPVLEEAVEPQHMEAAPARLAPQIPQSAASSSRDNSGDGHAAVAVAASDNDDDLTDFDSDSALEKALGDSLCWGRVDGDGEDYPEGDAIRHQEASRTIGLQTARIKTVLYVCPHVLVEQNRSVVAGIHAISPAKMCFVHEGRIVPTTFRVQDWSSKDDMDWQATSSPMAGCPSTFKLRPTCSVIYPAQNVICQECIEKHDVVGFQNADDAVLAHGLKEIQAQAFEKDEMHKEDMDVLWAQVTRPREVLTVQFYKGLTIRELHQNLSRRKRVRQTAHQIMRPALLDAPVGDEEELAWTPVKAARGGGLRITIQYDDHEFQAAFAQQDTVADLLRQLGRPDAVLRWAHYWLHEGLELVDFITEKLFLEEKQAELVCFRPYALCLRSEYISLAELTRWRALPGDVPVVWATDDIASIAGRGEFLKMLWKAHIMAVNKYACRLTTQLAP